MGAPTRPGQRVPALATGASWRRLRQKLIRFLLPCPPGTAILPGDSTDPVSCAAPNCSAARAQGLLTRASQSATPPESKPMMRTLSPGFALGLIILSATAFWDVHPASACFPLDFNCYGRERDEAQRERDALKAEIYRVTNERARETARHQDRVLELNRATSLVLGAPDRLTSAHQLVDEINICFGGVALVASRDLTTEWGKERISALQDYCGQTMRAFFDNLASQETTLASLRRITQQWPAQSTVELRSLISTWTTELGKLRNIGAALGPAVARYRKEDHIERIVEPVLRPLFGSGPAPADPPRGSDFGAFNKTDFGGFNRSDVIGLSLSKTYSAQSAR